MKIRLADGSGFIELRHLVEDVDRHGNVPFTTAARGCRKSVYTRPSAQTNLSRNIDKPMQASHNTWLRQMCRAAARPSQARCAG